MLCCSWVCAFQMAHGLAAWRLQRCAAPVQHLNMVFGGLYMKQVRVMRLTSLSELRRALCSTRPMAP